MMMDWLKDYYDILIFALIAVVLLWRLQRVLGSKQSDEPSLSNPFAPAALKDAKKDVKDKEKTSITDTARSAPGAAPVPSPVNWSAALPNFNFVDSATVHHRLIPFVAVDPNFRPDDFLDKAKRAFVTIVNAFGAGDKKTLAMLLSPALYQAFITQIDARAGGTYQAQLHGVQTAIITDANLDGTQGTVTVDFTAEQTITHKAADGTVHADAKKHLHKDRWVFSRNLQGADPTWKLIRTEEIS